MDSVTGKIKRVISHKPSKWSKAGMAFLVAQLDDGQKVLGEMARPANGEIRGETYRFYGGLRPDKLDPNDQVFHFDHFEAMVESTARGISDYLTRHVAGVGAARARAIFDAFGGETFHVLRTAPERVRDVPGITEGVAAAIVRHFQDEMTIDPAAYAAVVDLLAPYKVRRNLILRIVRDFGSDAPGKLRANPYLLCDYPRIGWDTIDTFALKTVGYATQGPERQKAAIREAMSRSTDDGHTVAPRHEIDGHAFGLIGFLPSLSSWVALIADGRIDLADEGAAIDDSTAMVALPRLNAAERRIAERLADLRAAYRPIGIEPDLTGLSDEQQAAVRMIVRDGVAILTGAPGVGKAQPLTSMILTPSGFVPMGSIHPGDQVIGSSGNPVTVNGIFPQGTIPVFRVTMDDGSSVECCDDHLWTVEDHNSRRWKTLTTSFLRSSIISTYDDRPRWTIPMMGAAEFVGSELPVDPYLMGVLLGDGCFRGDGISIMNPELEIQDSMRRLVPSGVECVQQTTNPMTFSFRKSDRTENSKNPNNLVSSIRSYGLHGHFSTGKFIPSDYLTGKIEDRIALLQGLLDTDGSVDRNNIEYSTSSPRLAEDVRFLVESLGGKVSTNSRIPKYTHKGENRQGSLSFRILVKLPNSIPPFRLTRKASAYTPRSKYPPRRRIVSIEPIGQKECQCISVDSPDHLYVTDRFIVTHNTWTVVKLLSELLRSDIGPIKLMAPTGKAAKRSEELLRAQLGSRASAIPCSTIHRALGIGVNDDEEGVPAESARVGRGRSQFGFSHDEHDPLDARVVVIEESSMCDVSLAAGVFSAIALGSMVLIVGDENQLPSVGPGSVLRDLIAAGIPTATLNEIRRSDGGGRVVRACHAIKDGRVPEPASRLSLPTENWIHVEASDPAVIAETICGLVAKVRAGSKLGLDPVWDVQVISGQKAPRSAPQIGTHYLNDRLAELLNPRPGETAGDDEGMRFKAGDKVIRRKNARVDEMVACGDDWGSDGGSFFWNGEEWSFQETAVVNGDMGMVEDIVTDGNGTHVIVRFRNPDRLCRLPLGSCHMERAYAITVHSAQGSGFRYTIVPCHHAFYYDTRANKGIWCRELVYTAISRAEEILVTVGDFSAVRAAIGRKTIQRRRTRLAERIRATIADRLPRGEEEGSAGESSAPMADDAIEADSMVPAIGDDDDLIF